MNPTHLRFARPLRLLALVLAFAGAMPLVPSRAEGGELHAEIDRLIASATDPRLLGPRTSDTEFARRIYLDLAGRVPTRGELQAWLDSSEPEKRAQLIDRLLAGAEHPRRMYELFHVMLMERRGDDPHWQAFLRNAFQQNLPWDQIARAIIAPDADAPHVRGAAYFQSARLTKEGAMAAVDVPGLTRDIGRLLAGVDLQCAQCHDHLTIDQYKQQDFQGLHMIFENVQTRRDVKFPAISENLMTGKKEFMSVFLREPRQTAPRVPGGQELEIVTFPQGEEYTIPPDKKKRTPGVPKFSPLQSLATELTRTDNRLFRENIANRVWFALLGRGLVEPLDLHHDANPPSHPELLELLGRSLAEHQFDLKWLIRQIALSETYQRSSRGAQSPDDLAKYHYASERRLSAEQLFWSAIVASETLDAAALFETSQAAQTGETQTGETQTAAAAADERPAGADDSQPPAIDRDPLERAVDDSKELSDLRERFTKTFANAPKEPELAFEPSVKAALFMMHDQSLIKLLERAPGNLIDRVVQLPAEETAAALFLAILSRPPDDDDRRDVAELLARHKDDRELAVRQLAWALLASTEFCLNH